MVATIRVEVPMRMLPKLVLAFGVFVPPMIVVAQNVAVGDTVWYVIFSFDIACRLLNLNFRSWTASKDL
jgi:hypothetical protein